MLVKRPAGERGKGDHGWLRSAFSFSFADYYDPKHMGFRDLRVINEDYVAPGTGFPMHPHRDMEIITYVLGGAVAHQDSMGTSTVVRPGEVQRMTAGTGVVHSEENPSKKETLHLLQIWIQPSKRALKPSYEQKTFPVEERTGKLRRVVAGEGRGAPGGALTMHQDADLFASVLKPGDRVTHELEAGRHAWVQVARGAITVNGVALAAGDGAAISEETKVDIAATADAELLLFDLR